MWESLSQWSQEWRTNYPVTFWIVLLGALISFKWAIDFIKLVKYLFFRGDLDSLIKAHGKGSYALVTGCTEGIGKSFAEELAKLGFNLVLISRNPQKLQELKSAISKIAPSCLIEVFAVDFSTEIQLSKFKQLAASMKHLDISMLVNNVGVDSIERFDQVPFKVMEDLMKINLYPLTFLSRELLAGMSKRGTGKKSSMITVSSQAGLLPMHHFNV